MVVVLHLPPAAGLLFSSHSFNGVDFVMCPDVSRFYFWAGLPCHPPTS